MCLKKNVNVCVCNKKKRREAEYIFIRKYKEKRHINKKRDINNVKKDERKRNDRGEKMQKYTCQK